MGVIVQFNYQQWMSRYPEFSGVTSSSAEGYFAEATLYHANDGSGPVSNAAQQLLLLNMLTAHIAKRYAILNGEAPSDLVGRINQASQGSVTVQAEFNSAAPGTAAWYTQSKYGTDYWQATAVFRSMRYRTNPNRRKYGYI